MGQSIEQLKFTPEDHAHFRRQLEQDLADLRDALQQAQFGRGEASLGAELEVYLIDRLARPVSCNVEVRELMQDPLLTLELNRFNLEYNLSPVHLSQQPFRHTEQQMLTALQGMRHHAAHYEARVLPIGILPTLQLRDFDHRTMTDLPRYHALRDRLRAERDGLFHIDIEGEEKLSLATDDITLEGANTSFQVHYRVDVERFADVFNAVQLVTPLMTAVAANSPIVFGQRLWHESRIPLFKKSIDSRQEILLDDINWQQPARVNFGHGWLREGAWELFAEAARLYPPLLPIINDNESIHHGSAPSLRALRLQLGTVWLWNRPVYDPHNNGHLRIEMRALPSGPSAADMLANAALYIGLAEGLSQQMGDMITALPFRHATQNFYRAARQGLDARIVWPRLQQDRLEDRAVNDLLRDLLPVADEGLAGIGISSLERNHYLAIIEQRLAARRSGANWQLESLGIFERYEKRPQALRRMLELYQEQSMDNLPVAQWQLP